MSLRNKSVQEIALDPKKFGAPTFEEFKKNREKYVGGPVRGSETLGIVDKGTSMLAKYVKRHKYEIAGRRVDTLEEVERIAHDYNIPIEKFTAECLPLGGGKCDFLIKFTG